MPFYYLPLAAKIEKPYLQATKIDDYTIEITGTENIKHVHFYIIFVKQNLLTIEDITYTNSQGNIIYIYLVTAGKNQISKCCMIISGHQLNYLDYYGAMITEPLLLEFEGKSEYQQDYRSQSCDVFMVIEENSKEYNEYLSKIKDMMEIEKNPYAYSDILK